jgi:hypothetical protein
MYGSPTATAIDAVDEACKVHDACYEGNNHYDCDLAFQASGMYGTPMKLILHTKGFVSHPWTIQATTTLAAIVASHATSKWQLRCFQRQEV